MISGCELNALADAMAHHLRALGAAHGMPIAILLPRSADSVIASFAILKTGAVCVPLDPEYPDERLNFLLDDAGIKLAITDLRPCGAHGRARSRG